MRNPIANQSQNSRLTIGIIILFIGILILLKPLIPYEVRSYLFSWQMILLSIGLIMGFANKFKGNAWWITSTIGGYFFITKFLRDLDFYSWFKNIQFPLFLIIIGCFVIYRARNNRPKKQIMQNESTSESVANTYDSNAASPMLPSDLFEDANVVNGANSPSEEATNHYHQYSEKQEKEAYQFEDESFNINAIFGTNRKVIKSKHYQGSNINSVFGNIYLDAVETEFDGVIYIDVLNLFGSIDLVLPANYDVRNELVPILGSVNDRRNQLRHNTVNTENKKYIVLKGTVLFGNVDIKS